MASKRKTMSSEEMAKMLGGSLPLDMARCATVVCPNRATCLRSTHWPADEVFSVAEFKPSKDGSCSWYIADLTETAVPAEDKSAMELAFERFKQRFKQ